MKKYRIKKYIDRIPCIGGYDMPRTYYMPQKAFILFGYTIFWWDLNSPHGLEPVHGLESEDKARKLIEKDFNNKKPQVEYIYDCMPKNEQP